MKIEPFVVYYRRLINSYNKTTHNILEKEIKLFLPQSISQHVDTGQLNVPPQQQPITLSLTKVMLDWIPDKLAHNAPSQSELQEARQAIPGCT